MSTGRGSHVMWWFVRLAGSLAVAAIALLFCGYHFGASDQAQYLVHALSLADPLLFVGDPYLEAFGSLYSVFWIPFALVVRSPWCSMVVLLVALGVAAANVCYITKIAGAVLRAPRAQIMGAASLGVLAFIVPKEQNWFGLVGIADVELTATYAVTPIVLLSIW